VLNWEEAARKCGPVTKYRTSEEYMRAICLEMGVQLQMQLPKKRGTDFWGEREPGSDDE
jgi:hypothetical protein